MNGFRVKPVPPLSVKARTDFAVVSRDEKQCAVIHCNAILTESEARGWADALASAMNGDEKIAEFLKRLEPR